MELFVSESVNVGRGAKVSDRNYLVVARSVGGHVRIGTAGWREGGAGGGTGAERARERVELVEAGGHGRGQVLLHSL